MRSLALLILMGVFVAAAAAQNLVADPTSVSLTAAPGEYGQVGIITVTSSGAPLSGIAVSASTQSGGNWLRVARDSLSTPATVGVLGDATKLSQGVYNGTVTITASSPVSRSLSIPVTFTVGSGGTPSSSFSVDRTTLSFAGQVNGAAPASQQINVSSTPSGTTFSVTRSTTDGSNWLQVSPTSGTAPAAITVAVNTTGLMAGNYSGTITLTPETGNPVTVSVSLSLAAPPGLNASPASLQFSYSVGGSEPAAQTINVSAPSATAFTVSVHTTEGGGWLTVAPLAGTTPQGLAVTVSPSTLATGVYHGTITLSAPTLTNPTVDVPVTLTVTNAGTTAGLQVDSTSLSFGAQSGGATPDTQRVAVGSNPPGISFLASVATTSGGDWLTVSPTTGTAPATLTVSVKTLPVGIYTGTITLTPATGAPVTIAVSLTITAGPAITASVSSLQFYYTIGTKTPDAQSFNVTAISSINFKVAASADVSGWLTASPKSAVAPNLVTVTVDPKGLASGTYSGKVTVSTATGDSIDVTVILTVSTGPLLVVNSSPLTFIFQPGGSNPPAQTVAIASTAYSVPFTAAVVTSDGGSWLTISTNAGTTPQNLTVAVAPGSLSAGVYYGTLTVSAVNVANSPVTIPITLTVSSSVLVASVLSVNFNYQIGGVNQVLAQPVMITASGGDEVPGTATPSIANCPSGWLQVSPTSFTTPATITVTLNPAGLSQPQSCAGVILLISNGSSTLLSVGVTVTTTPAVNITPLSLTLYAPSRSQSTTQTIEVSKTDNTLVPFIHSATTSTGGSWLSVTRADGTTKSTLTVSANPASLVVGAYSGTITIKSGSSQQWSIPVKFIVTPATSAWVNPQTLFFTQTVGGTPPPAQKVKLSTIEGGFAFTASVLEGSPASGVVSVSPTSGTTGTEVSVSILPNTLSPGSYNTALVLMVPEAGSKPLTVPISLTVADVPKGATIAASPQVLVFSVQQGGAAPAGQDIKLTSVGGSYNVAASVANGARWLKITPVASTTPSVVTVLVDPSGLAPATYNETVVLTSAGISPSPISVPVRLEVTAVPVILPLISGIANAASGVRGSIAPGEIVIISGDKLGPAEGVNFKLTSGGTVDTTLAGTQVFFDEVPAPLLYVSSGQINAIVPYEVAGRGIVQTTVSAQGVKSDPYTIQVGATAPGIFTTGQNGRGPAAALNSDNGLNALLPPYLPAKRAALCNCSRTGEGLLQPPLVTGSVTEGTHIPVAEVKATVAGLPAEVVFAGAAPQSHRGPLPGQCP